MKVALPWFFFLALAASPLAIPILKGDEAAGTARSLTMRECFEKALANNLEIQLERTNPQIQYWGIESAKSAFDPSLTAQTSYSDATTVPLDTERARKMGLSLSSGLTGKLPTGTLYTLNALDTRTSGTLNPTFVHTGNGSITLTQPMLKNFWLSPNTAPIRLARKSHQISVYNFVTQVNTTISSVSNAYYDLVFSIEDKKAKIETLNQAKALLSENRARVEIGVMASLDITQAEVAVAQGEEAVIVIERTIKDNENTLKRLISQNVAELNGVTLQPTDLLLVERIDTDAASSIRTALATRPDFLSARQELERSKIQVQFDHNQLWPEIDLVGSYGLNGRGGTFDEFTDNLASSRNPQWNVGVMVTVPLGNRQARANYRVAQLEAKQALIKLKQLEQDIIVQVDNAVGHVQTNFKSVETTHVASGFAEESLRTEEAKLKAGTSTSFLVLQAQALLATARSAEIGARADYSKSLVELWKAEGTTLQKNNMVLDEKF